MRLDIERRYQLDPVKIAVIGEWLEQAASEISVIVLSDYAKGILAPALIEQVMKVSHAYGIPVIVDTKISDLSRFAGASVLTPNALEAAMITGVECSDDHEAERAAKILHELAMGASIVLTRGAQGMTVFDATDSEQPIAHIPALVAEVFDVSGAGDTVVAGVALALASGAPVRTAAQIGNAAAGLAVSKRGTAVVDPSELLVALGGATAGNPKIVDNETVFQVVANWKANGLTIGFTNGCFDLLHPGHVELLKNARAACDRLVVALNSDISARRLKGATRPVQSEGARCAVVAAMTNVDLVTLFEEETPIRLIERIHLIVWLRVQTIPSRTLSEQSLSKPTVAEYFLFHSRKDIVQRILSVAPRRKVSVDYNDAEGC